MKTPVIQYTVEVLLVVDPNKEREKLENLLEALGKFGAVKVKNARVLKIEEA